MKLGKMKKSVYLVLLMSMLLTIGCTSKKDNNSTVNTYEQKQKEEKIRLYSELNGMWTAENGDYFNIYDGNGEWYYVDYSLGEETGTKTYVFFKDNYCAIENNISISYLENGDCEGNFVVLLSEDGKTFEYEGTVFTRE